MARSETHQATITNLTRKKVIQAFARTSWSGDRDDVVLWRLYDLGALPSTDSRCYDAAGDIYQHRVAYLDWDDSWIFSDERFGLRDGSDRLFLRFIAESVHPEVRGDSDQAERIVREVNAHLARDGWELRHVEEISGYAVYGPRRRSRATTPRPNGFPIDPDSLTASMAEMLKSQGQARELAVLADSDVRIDEVSYDRRNGGSTGWRITCLLYPSLDARLTTEDRAECEEGLHNAAAEFFRPFSSDFVARVVIAPSAAVRDQWRAAANEWLSGQGINNQGRVRSDNLASLEVDGLLFRSRAEINLYRAFKGMGVTFAPLPVFVRGGGSYARLSGLRLAQGWVHTCC